MRLPGGVRLEGQPKNGLFAELEGIGTLDCRVDAGVSFRRIWPCKRLSHFANSRKHYHRDTGQTYRGKR